MLNCLESTYNFLVKQAILMKRYVNHIVFFIYVLTLLQSCTDKNRPNLNMDNLYPWCIVAFDSLERTPTQRIKMLKELGFTKYAYDWRDKDLNDMKSELELAKKNNIEVVSVWLWLNAKRDSLSNLSPSNEKVFEILKESNLRTNLWLSFSNNFFEDLTQEESINYTAEMIKSIKAKADKINCKIQLYNHKGWFGNPDNQVKIIESLPDYDLKMVYNFHHAHNYLENFPQIVKTIKPHLASVNLNGMQIDGAKILPIGKGEHEKDMIKLLLDEGFNGTWGILGHVENKDVEIVLKQNLSGLESLQLNF